MNASAKYCGVVVPMVSPFTAAGTIDEAAAARIVEHLIAGGVDGIFVLGTTGEAASIHPDQRPTLVRSAVSAAKGRATLYAGISGNCVRESIESAKQFHQLGIDAAVAHPPYSFTLPDADLERYFVSLADAIPLPLILYNMPKTTHVSIPLETVVRLMQHPNIAGIKDSESSPERLSELVRLTASRPEFPVLAGTAAVFVHALKAGAHGIVPGTANLCPELYASLHRAALAGQWEQVDQFYAQTAAVTAQYQKPGATLGESLARLKAMMAARGFCSPAMLPPLVQAREQA